MTLQRKTLLIFGTSFLCLLVTLYWASSRILQASIAASERANAQHTLRASRGLLDQMVDQFSQKFADWAAWDDAYAFVQKPNPAFIQSNLIDPSLKILRVHLIMFFNSSGGMVFGTGFDPAQGKKTPIPPRIQEVLRAAPGLLHFDAPTDSRAGLLSVNGRLMIVMVRPIVTSEVKGPIRGAMLVGRELDAAEMRRLADWGGVALAIWSLADGSLPADSRQARDALLHDVEPGGGVFTMPLSDKQLGAYGILRDIEDKPTLLVQAVVPRDSYQQGLVSLRYLVLALFTSALVFGSVTLWMMRQLVLSPVLIMGDQVRRIRDAGNPAARVSVAGDRELSGLASDINGMLGALEQSQAKLRESEERFRSATQNAAIGMALVAPDGRWLQANRALCNILGYSEEELKQITFQEVTQPEDLAANLDYLRRTLAGELHTYQLENRYRHKRGHTVWALLTASLVRDSQGQPLYFVSQIQDISTRKQAEAQLQDAHQNLKARVDELEQRNTEMRLVGEMGEMLQSCRSREEAGSVIVQMLQRLFAEEVGALCVMDPLQDRVTVLLSWGDVDDAHLAPGHHFMPDECWALRRGRPQIVEDPETTLLCAHVPPDIAVGYLCLPLMAERQTLGVLHLCQQERVPWPAPKLQLARTVAEHISLALFNLELQATLRNQSARDPLTGLFNRRHMEESLERELSRAKRNSQPVSIILFDVDHFKRFNDTFGHDAGDFVLKEIGAMLKAKSRTMDVACRYGGEEFLLILPDCALSVARERAEQLRQTARDMGLRHLGTTLSQVTLSLGVVVYPDHGANGDALLRAADTLLYRAKHEGRDRAISGEPVVLPPVETAALV